MNISIKDKLKILTQSMDIRIPKVILDIKKIIVKISKKIWVCLLPL